MGFDLNPRAWGKPSNRTGGCSGKLIARTVQATTSIIGKRRTVELRTDPTAELDKANQDENSKLFLSQPMRERADRSPNRVGGYGWTIVYEEDQGVNRII